VSLASFPGYDRLVKKLERVQNLDPMPLLLNWGAVMIEDNRAGILSGLDKDGNPLAPVTYRGGAAIPTKFRANKKAGHATGTFKSFGPLPNTLDPKGGNLSNKQYKLLTGPPLAPRLDESRVIANFSVIPPYYENGLWVVEGFWGAVYNRKGRPFLHYHFDGDGQKRRDLRGVRPEGKRKMVSLLRSFVKAILGAP
jgi:hypothetical protein